MSYKTKRVFIKNANGTYTEISYEEFRRRKAADKSFKKRKFVRVFVDTLMEVDEAGYHSIESLRRHIRHLRTTDKEHNLEFLAEVPHAARLDKNEVSESLEDALEKKMMIEKLRSCIPKLTEKQQELVQYLYFDNLSQEEVAKIFGITQSAVSQRKATVIKKLRKLMTSE